MSTPITGVDFATVFVKDYPAAVEILLRNEKVYTSVIAEM